MSIFATRFKSRECAARTGILDLPHGRIRTPVFMPVGTAATVKAVAPETLRDYGFGIILANTYHLFLRPGNDVVREAGGLHGFSGWKGNILTDSGGFQVFSLSPIRKITEEGVAFRSHVDGSRHVFTPESVVDVQTDFNSDVQMQLDVCTGYGVSEKEMKRAATITTSWAIRAKRRWLEKREEGYRGSLFGIIQGNFDKVLRKRCREEILSLDLPGVAIGGLSVGEPKSVFEDFLEYTAEGLPDCVPRYLMGIGTPDYILSAIERGIDMFDCVFPTRVARNGMLFTSLGPLSIKNKRFERDFLPPDPACGCRVCANHSRAYLRHLFRSGEILYSMLASEHNLAFLADLVAKARYSIEDGTFSSFKRDFLARYGRDEES